MMHFLSIAAGGAIGATLRHALVLWTGPTLGRGFPMGHFVVNAIGCVLIGVLFVALAARESEDAWRLFLVSGILGAFTTYSAFSLDAVALLESGEMGMALSYVAATLASCIGGCWLGLSLGRALLS